MSIEGVKRPSSTLPELARILGITMQRLVWRMQQSNGPQPAFTNDRTKQSWYHRQEVLCWYKSLQPDSLELRREYARKRYAKCGKTPVGRVSKAAQTHQWLKENGPATVAEIRKAGQQFDGTTKERMLSRGFIRKVGDMYEVTDKPWVSNHGGNRKKETK